MKMQEKRFRKPVLYPAELPGPLAFALGANPALNRYFVPRAAFVMTARKKAVKNRFVLDGKAPLA
jgi:hypothetical protein